MLENVLTIFITLFSVIDMLGNIPLIIKLRKENGGHISSLKGTIIATAIMIVSLFLGQELFRLLGIEVFHFAIAGSLLLLYFGVKMVLGIEDKKQGTVLNATVFPIAFPLIAGPGTLSTIMSFRASFSEIEIVIGILLNAIVIFAVLKMAGKIQKVIGENGIMIIERFFGVILISIGIKIFLENLVVAINSVGL